MILLNQSRAQGGVRGPVQRGRTADRQRRVNVGEDERVISVVAGTMLAALGLGRRGLGGLVTAGLGGALVYRGATGVCPGYQSLGYDTAEDQSSIHVSQAYTINKPVEEVYRFWRDFENLPRVMKHLRSVRVGDDGHSHWVAEAPALIGGQVEWDAEITEDVANERIAWRSLADADVEHWGAVRFEKGTRGTVVRVEMNYVAPAGHVGRWTAKAFGEAPEQEIREDLRNVKRYMETGETPTLDGQPRGTCLGAAKRLFG